MLLVRSGIHFTSDGWWAHNPNLVKCVSPALQIINSCHDFLHATKNWADINLSKWIWITTDIVIYYHMILDVISAQVACSHTPEITSKWFYQCMYFTKMVPYSCLVNINNISFHDEVMIWKRFPHYWPFGREPNRSSNSRDAGDLRHHDAFWKTL